MSGFITAKIASAASNIETTGKALSFGAAVGTSGGKLLGWINANLLALCMSLIVFILLVILIRRDQPSSKVSLD